MNHTLPHHGVDRRSFMAGAAASVAILSGQISAEAAEKETTEVEKGWIDAHSHIWTRDIKSYPLAKGTTLDDLDPPSFTVKELLETAGREGVSRVVLIAHHKFYATDNSYMTDAVKQHPGVFRVVGMINEVSGDPAAKMRRLLKQGVTGFRITPAIRGRDQWLVSDGMKQMWSTAADTGQAICCLVNPEDLPDIDRMCQQNPETTVVIDHFGRIGIDSTIREADLKNLCRLARHKHTYVKVSAYYALGKKQPPYDDLVPMIRRLHEAFGAKRLMWASDSPYQLQGDNTYKASISLVRDGLPFLSDEDRQWLLRNTAQQVYFKV